METKRFGNHVEDDKPVQEASTSRAAAPQSTTGISAANVQAGNIHIQIIKRTKYFKWNKKPVTSFRMVDLPIRDFQGRHELLTAIHATLQGACKKMQQRSVYWQDRAVVLSGFGGMGKSELARKFAIEYSGCYSAAWLEAETERSLDRSLRQLAKELGLHAGPGVDTKTLSKRVFDHAGKHVPSALFIFDNAQKLRSTTNSFGIFDYLRSDYYENPPLILITSRTRVEWASERVAGVFQVTELAQNESTEFLRLQLGIPDEKLRSDKILMAMTQKLSEHIQGYPLGLLLAAGQIKFSPSDDPISALRKNLESYMSVFQEEIAGVHFWGPFPPQEEVSYPQSFDQVWNTTMRTLSSENRDSVSIHLLRILAYCDPDRTEIKDLRQIFATRASAEARNYGGATFDSALTKLKELSLISECCCEGWPLIPKNACVRVHRIVQKRVRYEDRERIGLQSILLSKKHFLLLNYMSCKPFLAIPPCVLRSDRLIDGWLLCFGYALRQNPDFPFSTTLLPRLEFNSQHKRQLKNRASSRTDEVLAAVELIHKIAKETDVRALYLTAVEYARKNPTSVLHHLAEFCAFKCWTSRPFSCNPFVYPLFIFILVVSGSVILSLSLLFCTTLVNQQYSPAFWWDCEQMIYVVCFVVLLLWLLGTPKSYFWFRMVLETEAWMASPGHLLCEAARLATSVFINGLAIYEGFQHSLHYTRRKLDEYQRDWEGWIQQWRVGRGGCSNVLPREPQNSNETTTPTILSASAD